MAAPIYIYVCVCVCVCVHKFPDAYLTDTFIDSTHMKL